ncbi:MAG: recombinase family protein [Bacilli bacterium]
MELTEYGYVRVSTKDQHLDRQLVAMEEIGILEENIFQDKQSGKDFNRVSYQKLLAILKEGDTLYVKSIDRLGRNYDDIIEQWRIITKIKKADVVVLDFPLLNTKEQTNGLTGKFIADIVLQIMSYVAEVERKNIKQRQKEGIKVAKDKGKHMGRPPKPIPDNFQEVLTLWENKEITARQAGIMLNTSHQMFIRWVKKQKKDENIAE